MIGRTYELNGGITVLTEEGGSVVIAGPNSSIRIPRAQVSALSGVLFASTMDSAVTEMTRALSEMRVRLESRGRLPVRDEQDRS